MGLKMTDMTRWMRRAVALTLTLSALSSGCSVYKVTGDTLSGYTAEHLAPYVLGTDDVGMACEMGVSMGPLLLSFERVTASPDYAAVPTLLTSALCAEQQVWGEELRSVRAYRAKAISEYQDARTAQKRAHGLAASRYWKAYQRVERLFPIASYQSEGCPELDELGELTMIMGLISGVQAVQHDRASGVMVGVPTDTPRKVITRAQCFNEEANRRWWGVPRGIEAAIWMVVPGSGPKGSPAEVQARSYQVLAESAELGREAGVRLVDSIFAYAAQAMGDEPKVREVISAFAKARAERPAAERWRLLDETSALQLRALSDLIWTREAGHRTPVGQLGQFWVDPEAQSADEGSGEGDSLLDDL